MVLGGFRLFHVLVTMYSVHEHYFGLLGFEMLTVGTAIFHWLYFDYNNQFQWPGK